jgi:uncharacterized protein YegL
MRLRAWVVALVLGSMALMSAVQLGVEAAEPSLVSSVDIGINIDNSYAVTAVTEVLKNPGTEAANASFNVQVPEGAFISNFSLTVDGTTYYGSVITAQVAQQKYDQAVSSGKTAGMLSARGKSLFSYAVNVKAGQEVKVQLVFEEFLKMKGGWFEYSLYLNETMFGGQIPSMGIHSNIDYSSAITDVAIQNYSAGTTVDRLSPYTVSTTYNAQPFNCSGNYVIRYGVSKSAGAGRVIPYADGTDTYFMHIFAPEMKELGGSPMPKQIVFVLDKSGSMDGDKITQLKSAFDGILNQLREEDQFNIVVFDTSIRSWQASLVKVTPENRNAARNFMSGINAGGSTDLNGALLNALGDISSTDNQAPIIVMLTDGQPTAGVTGKAQIRANVKSANTCAVPIYCLGFGSDVDFDFLQALSLENNARALRIYTDKDAADQIRDFYSTISSPLMKGIKFSYEPAADTYPKGVGYLYDGSEIVVVGKLNGTPQDLKVTVNGNDRDGVKSFSASFGLLGGTSSIPARFWNYAKVQELLDRITVDGSNTQLVNEVTDLSIANSFVTPYTSMYVEIGEKKQAGADMKPTDTTSKGTASSSGNTGGSGSGGNSNYNTPSTSQGTPSPTPPQKAPTGTGAEKSMAVPFPSEAIFLALFITVGIMAVRRRSK